MPKSTRLAGAVGQSADSSGRPRAEVGQNMECSAGSGPGDQRLEKRQAASSHQSKVRSGSGQCGSARQQSGSACASAAVCVQSRLFGHKSVLVNRVPYNSERRCFKFHKGRPVAPTKRDTEQGGGGTGAAWAAPHPHAGRKNGPGGGAGGGNRSHNVGAQWEAQCSQQWGSSKSKGAVSRRSSQARGARHRPGHKAHGNAKKPRPRCTAANE